MIREKELFLRRLLVLFDSIIVIFSYLTTDFYLILTGQQSVNKSDVIWLSVFFLVFIYIILFSRFGVYRPSRTRPFSQIFFSVIKTSAITAFILIAFNTFFNSDQAPYSKQFIFVYLLISASLLVMEKISIFAFSRFIREKGYNIRYVIIVGTGRRACKVARLIKRHKEWGFQIIGLIDKDPALLGTKKMGVEVIGILDDVPNILRERVVDQVIFVVPRLWLGDIEPVILKCELRGVETYIALDLFNLQITHGRIDNMAGLPLLNFNPAFMRQEDLFIKRAIDIFASLLLLVLLSPVFLFVAIMIKTTSEGPIIFKQIRCGLNGRKFRMLKFRSMVMDAETMMGELKKLSETDGPVFKMEKDPRLTPIGSFLRKASIDELPQLINVLMGEMSLVGPRPPLPQEVEQYDDWQRRKLSLRPGITCLWQVSGRSTISFRKWMELDLVYIDNWSLGLDFKILLRTIPAVLLQKGAK